MSFQGFKSVNDLICIASVGGGFEIERGFLTVDDLWRIAAAAGSSGARITFAVGPFVTVDDMVRIASPGKGAVTFKQ